MSCGVYGYSYDCAACSDIKKHGAFHHQRGRDGPNQAATRHLKFVMGLAGRAESVENAKGRAGLRRGQWYVSICIPRYLQSRSRPRCFPKLASMKSGVLLLISELVYDIHPVRGVTHVLSPVGLGHAHLFVRVETQTTVILQPAAREQLAFE